MMHIVGQLRKLVRSTVHDIQIPLEKSYVAIRGWNGREEEKYNEWRPINLPYPGVCFGSIYVDGADRFRKPTNPVMVVLYEVNSWFVQEPAEGYGEHFAPSKSPRYVPAKWFISGTPWERSPNDFAAALQRRELGQTLTLSTPLASPVVPAPISSPPQKASPVVEEAFEVEPSGNPLEILGVPPSTILDIKEEEHIGLTVSPQFSNSESDEDGYGRPKGELADLRKDYNDQLDDSLKLEHTLLKADGKVMLLTGVLRQAYNAGSHLNQGLKRKAQKKIKSKEH